MDKEGFLKSITPPADVVKMIEKEITDAGLEKAEYDEDGTLAYDYFIKLHTLATKWHLDGIVRYR